MNLGTGLNPKGRMSGQLRNGDEDMLGVWELGNGCTIAVATHN